MGEEATKGPLSEFDDVDLQIIALRKDNPRIPIRKIGERVGLSSNAVWKRLRKIGESDWILDARNECIEMLPLALHVYCRALADKTAPIRDRLAAARDVLYGLAVLRKQSEVSGLGGGPIPTSGIIVYLPDNGRGIADAD